MTLLTSTSAAHERCVRTSAQAPIPPHASASASVFAYGDAPVIIVVSPSATPEDLDIIVAHIEATGRQAHLSVGVERSIIGVIGPDAPELQDMFETLPH